MGEQIMTLDFWIDAILFVAISFALMLLYCICKVGAMHSRWEEERENRHDL